MDSDDPFYVYTCHISYSGETVEAYMFDIYHKLSSHPYQAAAEIIRYSMINIFIRSGIVKIGDWTTDYSNRRIKYYRCILIYMSLQKGYLSSPDIPSS